MINQYAHGGETTLISKARAYCYSDDCNKRVTHNQINNAGNKDRKEKQVAFWEVKCPDCGHMLFWTSRFGEEAFGANLRGRVKGSRKKNHVQAKP